KVARSLLRGCERMLSTERLARPMVVCINFAPRFFSLDLRGPWRRQGPRKLAGWERPGKFATQAGRLPTERGWQCWQRSKKVNKSKHVITLTLGRLPTLSFGG